MAEVVLGVAASVVQLVDAVTRLARICGSLRDASSDLSDLITVLSISVEQLNRSKRYFEKAPLIDLVLVTQCIQHLEQAVLAVNATADAIRPAFNRHKAIGSIKFVSKSRQIQELKQKMKNAQELMDRTERSIDQQIVQGNHELLIQILEKIQHNATSNSATQLSLPPPEPQLALGPRARPSPTNSECLLKYREYKIVLPQWVSSKVFKVAFEQQQWSIGFQLRSYNIVPAKSDVFEAVRSGDLDRVRHLFKLRSATPFDIMSSGQSLLDLAAYSCQPHICQLLLNEGAEIAYIDNAGRSALHYLTSGFIFDIDLSRCKDYKKVKQFVTEMVELLAELVPRDDHDMKELAARDSQDPLYLSSMRFISNGGFSNIRTLSHEDRAEMIMGTCQLDFIKEILGSDLSAREVFMYAKAHGLSHRKYLEEIFRRPEEERHRWSWFVRELLAVDQSLLTEDFQGQMDAYTSIVGLSLYHTVFGNKVSGLFSDLPSKSNRLLQVYLVDLQNHGADLEVFGQKEEYMFRQTGWSEYYWDSDLSSGFRWRMTGLTTGPSLSDWKIWLAPENREYELAGQFWHRIENPEFYMPGAFPREQES